MIDLVDALIELLEPDPSAAAIRDRTAAAPFDYRPNTVYAWIDSARHVSVGTGEVQEDFAIRVVYVADGQGENAEAGRKREVSEALDAKGVAYLDAIRANETNVDVPWHSITGSIDHDFIRQLEVRGVSILATGWRLVT